MKNLLDTEWQENINDINNPVFIETVITLLTEQISNKKIGDKALYIVVPFLSTEGDYLFQLINAENDDIETIQYGYKNRGNAFMFLNNKILSANLAKFFEYGAEYLAVIGIKKSLDTLTIQKIVELIMFGDQNGRNKVVDSENCYVALYFKDNVLVEII